jgi:hypothetical protein
MTRAESGLFSDSGTASEIVEEYQTPRSQTTLYAASVAWLRTTMAVVSDGVRELHHVAVRDDLDFRTSEKARKGVRSLLSELADGRGLGWNDIASLVGVSLSAVRKWRQGGDATPDSRTELARLAAFMDILAEWSIEDPASWMELTFPLPSGYRIRPVDLYKRRQFSALLDIATMRRTPEEVLSDVDPLWQERRSQYDVVDGPDGDKIIMRRQG